MILRKNIEAVEYCNLLLALANLEGFRSLATMYKANIVTGLRKRCGR